MSDDVVNTVAAGIRYVFPYTKSRKIDEAAATVVAMLEDQGWSIERQPTVAVKALHDHEPYYDDDMRQEEEAYDRWWPGP